MTYQTDHDSQIEALDEKISQKRAQRNKFNQIAEDRALTSDEKAEFSSVKSDYSELLERRDRAQAMREGSIRVQQSAERSGLPPAKSRDEANTGAPGHGARDGLTSMIEGRAASATLERRSLLASAATGGQETIETRVLRNFYEVMDQFSGVWRVAGKIETGNDESPVKLPVVADFGRGDQELPEGAEITADDATIESVEFGAYRYTGIQSISNTLANSSVVDTGMLVSSALAKRIVREYRDRLTIGTGTGQPQGLTVGASAGPTAAAADAITEEELFATVHALAPEYRDTMMSSWVMHDSTWQQIRQLKGTDGHYLVGDLGNGADMRLLGYPVVIDQAMPIMEAGNRALTFGAIADGYRIRHTATRVNTSTDYRFETDEMSYRIVMALDAKVIDPSAIVALEMGA